VFVPEDWQRAYRGELASLRVLNIVRALIIAVVFLLAAAFGIVAWTRRAFPVRFALRFFALMIVFGILASINGWPGTEARFPTSQPYELQLGLALIGMALGQLVIASLFALIAGWCLSELPASSQTRAPVGAALAVGALAAGITVALGRLSAASYPLIGGFGSAQALWPWGDSAVDAGVSLLTRATGLLAVLTLARGIGAGDARRPLSLAFLFVVGGLVAMPQGMSSVGSWFAVVAIYGAGIVLLEWLVLSRDTRIVPGLVAAMAALAAVRGIVRNAHADAALGGVLELIVIALVLAWWMRQLGPGRASVAGAPA
jgi:hypothetical protein